MNKKFRTKNDVVDLQTLREIIKSKKSTTKDEGGGISASIKNGIIFDSVGVNISEVSGKFHKKFKNQN